MNTKAEKRPKVHIISACVEDPTKVIGEANLSGEFFLLKPFFNMKKLCKILREKVSYVQCSEELGVAKFTLKGKKITLFKNGRIVIKMAKNKQDVENTIKKIKEIVRESILY